jgi:hypothetical protein
MGPNREGVGGWLGFWRVWYSWTTFFVRGASRLTCHERQYSGIDSQRHTLHKHTAKHLKTNHEQPQPTYRLANTDFSTTERL